MDISALYILYSITIAYVAYIFLTWLVKYLHRVYVINKIKGPFMIPFIGNIYQVKQYDPCNLNIAKFKIQKLLIKHSLI